MPSTSGRDSACTLFAATLRNDAVAATFGHLVAQWLPSATSQNVLGVAFIAMAAWALVPDQQDENAAKVSAHGIFLSTLVVFFVVAIGDKTQIATRLLAARFHNVEFVTIGTTIGMMLANVRRSFWATRQRRSCP